MSGNKKKSAGGLFSCSTSVCVVLRSVSGSRQSSRVPQLGTRQEWLLIGCWGLTTVATLAVAATAAAAAAPSPQRLFARFRGFVELRLVRLGVSLHGEKKSLVEVI